MTVICYFCGEVLDNSLEQNDFDDAPPCDIAEDGEHLPIALPDKVDTQKGEARGDQD